MILQNPERYTLLGFEKSNVKHKKYNAILTDGIFIKKVPFGDSRYGQYQDKIGLYSHYDHFDKKRREDYLLRHYNDYHNKFSSGYFAMRYLW